MNETTRQDYERIAKADTELLSFGKTDDFEKHRAGLIELWLELDDSFQNAIFYPIDTYEYLDDVWSFDDHYRMMEYEEFMDHIGMSYEFPFNESWAKHLGDAPIKFDMTEAINSGAESAVDAYLSGVPLEDIIA